MSLGTLLVSPLRRSLFATSFTGINIKLESPGTSWPRSLGARSFTQTCISRATHYETLGVPQNATKGQIKSSFYSVRCEARLVCFALMYRVKLAQQEISPGYQS